ncbi:hypothetical protein Tco_0953798 [Tanacetum coccineum]|uniref:Uncharacterized protein n=1 Tax=Tanacetum coccineum TaxID=301880 RepID=A0ABQ5E1A4_9ASTR
MLPLMDQKPTEQYDEIIQDSSNFFKNVILMVAMIYVIKVVWIKVAKMKVIKERSEKLGLHKIDDDSFACNSPLGITFDEFNRLSGMDDDFFTYEDDGDLDVYETRVCYGENDGIYAEAVIFVNKRLVRLMDGIVEQWLDLMYYDHKKVDIKIMEGVIHWTRGDDEVELIDEEFSDPDNENLIDKGEVAEIFRIETDIFDFETPICKAFNEFNYLLKIDTYLLTSADKSKITRKQSKIGKHGHENQQSTKPKPESQASVKVSQEKSKSSQNGQQKYIKLAINDIRHICEPFRFKNGKAKWPTYNSNDEGFCNGGELPRMVRVGYMTYFQDYEWYNDLVDGKLKEEALKQKSKYERSWGNATQGVINFCASLNGCFRNFHELDYELLVKLEEYWWKMNDHEYSPFSNWKNHINEVYTNTNIDANYNPYMDVSRTFNNHEGWNDEKDILEERERNDDHGIDNLDNDLVLDNASYHDNNEEYKENRCEFLRNPRQEPLVCEIRRFEIIKYSFRSAEKYLAINECEYAGFTRTKDDACHAYQEILRIMDKGWFVTRSE